MDPSPDVGAVERDLATYYDREAGDRAERSINPRRVDGRTRFIARLGPHRPRTLEVGIGPGLDAAAFVADAAPVFGVDLSCEHARRATAQGAHVTVGSVRQLPFRDGSFAALWTMSTLMHVPNASIAEAVGEIRRVLAVGALGAIGVWGGPDVEEYDSPGTYGPPRLFSRRSDDRWRSLLAVIGSIEEYETWDHEPGRYWYQWAVVRAG